MIWKQCRLIFRNLMRHKVFTFLNIAGLALGIAVFCLIIGYVRYEMSADKFHVNYDRIFRIDLNERFAVVPITMKQEVIDAFPELVGTRYFPRSPNVFWDEKKLGSSVTFVDPEFFDIFTFEALRGDLKEAVSAPGTAIVTESWAKKMFGDEDPLGQTIQYEREAVYTVTAVMKDPGNSQLMVQGVILPFESLKALGVDFENRSFGNYVTYLLLPEYYENTDIVERINTCLADYSDRWNHHIRPLKDLYFDASKFDYSNHGDLSTVRTYLIVALFILLIACVNYINLATSRASLRAKEVGVRKVFGSTQGKLMTQFLVESILLCLLTLIPVAVALYFFYPVFSGFYSIRAPFFTAETILGLILLAVLVGVIAGLYPSVVLSAFKPIRVLKGEISRGVRGGWFRKILTVFQFAISITMIICMLTIQKQLDFFRNHDLGFDKEQIITFSITNEIRADKENFRQELLKNPGIEDVSYIYTQMGRVILSSTYNNPETDETNQFRMIFTDPAFIDVYGLTMAQGRFFDANLETDHDCLVVNQTFIDDFGIDNPLEFKLWEDATVIGVVDDFFYRPLRYEIEPLVILWDPDETYATAVRISGGNIPEKIEAIEKTYHSVSPEVDFDYEFQNETFEKFYRNEKRFGMVFRWFSAIAVAIACLGMFGLASFMALNRTREIGIRKVFGARPHNIVLLLSSEFTKLVLVSNLIAWPLAYYVMSRWLDTFAYRMKMDFISFLLASVIALVIAWITVGYQTIRASRTEPSAALKYE